MAYPWRFKVGASLCLALGLTGCGSGSGGGGNVSADCQPKHDFSTINKGSLAVGVYVAPPYTTPSDGGSGPAYGGVDGAIIERIAKEECLSLDEQPMDATALFQTLQSKRVDVLIGGVGNAPGRDKLMNVSDTMYRINLSFVSAEGFDKFAQIQGKRIGLVNGYRWVPDFKKAFPSSELHMYNSMDGVLTDLKNHRVDVAVLDDAEARYAVKAMGAEAELKVEVPDAHPKIDASQHPTLVVLMSTKGNDDMTRAFNADIEAMLNSGEIKTLLTENGLDPSEAGGENQSSVD